MPVPMLPPGPVRHHNGFAAAAEADCAFGIVKARQTAWPRLVGQVRRSQAGEVRDVALPLLLRLQLRPFHRFLRSLVISR